VVRLTRANAAVEVTGGFTAATATVVVNVVGTGTVTSADGKISCSGSCSYSYPPNTPILLHPASLDTFQDWTGCLDRTSGGGCGLSNLAAGTTTTVTATFGPSGTPTVTPTPSPSGSPSPHPIITRLPSLTFAPAKPQA
jgi:hypothetical protein